MTDIQLTLNRDFLAAQGKLKPIPMAVLNKTAQALLPLPWLYFLPLPTVTGHRTSSVTDFHVEKNRYRNLYFDSLARLEKRQ